MLSEGDVAWRTEVSPGQCVILVDAGLFFIDEPNHHLWIDNLFIRFQSTGAVANESAVVVGNNGDELSGDPRGIVVANRGASVYCTNLSFMVAIDSLAGGFKVAALWNDASRLYFQGALPVRASCARQTITLWQGRPADSGCCARTHAAQRAD